MDVKKCDRCGRIYTENDLSYKNKTIVGVNVALEDGLTVCHADLCDKCQLEFGNWFIVEREKAYKQGNDGK